MKDKFIKNAFILSIGIFISKLLGFLFVIPFSNIVGKNGLALYSYAYVPYALFIDLATLGIPMGFSKFVSINKSIGNDEYINYAFNKLKKIMIIFGILGFLIMFLIAPYYAALVKGDNYTVEEVTTVIQIVSATLLFVPIMSLYRGFYQGIRIMKYSSISQIVEQIVRITIILIGAYIAITIYKNITLAISIAVSGALFGAIVSFIILRIFINRYKTKKTEKRVGMYKEILKYSLPFLIFGSCLTMYSFIDSLMFNKIINNEIIYGIYSFEIPKIVLIPVSIVTAISSALLPNIAHYFKRKEYKIVKTNFLKGLALIGIITIPSSIFVFIFNDFSYNFLFQSNEYGPNILRYYIPLSILFALSSLTMSMMQGINLGKILSISIISGIFVKLILNYTLITKLGYIGAILSTSLGYILTITINLFFIIKILRKNSSKINSF